MSIFWHSVETVLVLFLMGTAGYWLAKKGILDSETRHKLSQALMTIFLPALVIAQLMPAASQSDWKALWVLPLLGFLNIVFGLILGAAAAFLGKKKGELLPSMAAMAFTNTGYVPMSLLLALALTHPFATPEGDIGKTGCAYVALYLVVFSPLLWLIGYNLIAFGGVGGMKWKKCLTPPGITALATLVVAFTPLSKLFLGPSAPLGFAFSAATLLCDAVCPLAIVLLGASLGAVENREKIEFPYLFSFAFLKYLAAPAFALLCLFVIRKAGIAVTPLMALVIILEGCMPPGLNLIIICQNEKKHVPFMTSLLFVSYIIFIPFLVLWLFLAFNITKTI